MSRLALFLALVLFAAPAGAQCYADYKAKVTRDDGSLGLHYGVMQLPDEACSDARIAERTARERVARGGWELLNVVGTFGPGGLDRRRESAGEFFLRF